MLKEEALKASGSRVFSYVFLCSTIIFIEYFGILEHWKSIAAFYIVHNVAKLYNN